MSQLPSKLAVGIPNVLTSGTPEMIDGGMALRVKNQMRIAVEVHSQAYTPPPFALKASPELLSWVADTVHPVKPAPA